MLPSAQDYLDPFKHLFQQKSYTPWMGSTVNPASTSEAVILNRNEHDGS